VNRSRILAISALLSILSVSACGEYRPEQNEKMLMDENSQVLPVTVAQPPVTINMPRRIQNPPPAHATIEGHTLHFYSNVAWYGHQVEIFYVPRHDLFYHSGHYQLNGTKNVQKVAQGTIQPNGTWSVRWNYKSFPLSDKEPLFFIIRTNEGQFGLVRTYAQE
jgi:hypothetical protein